MKVDVDKRHTIRHSLNNIDHRSPMDIAHTSYIDRLCIHNENGTGFRNDLAHLRVGEIHLCGSKLARNQEQ